MSMFDGLKNVLGINQDPDGDAYIDDTEDEIYAGGKPGAAVPDYAQPEPAQQRNKVVNINATTQLQVVLVKPERFDDASTIADQLNAKRTVGAEPGIHQQGGFPPADRLFVRRGLRQQRPDQAGCHFYLHHYAVQCRYHGRPDRRNLKTMASSSDCNTTPRRGFVPPQDEAERFLFRRVEELARLAEARAYRGQPVSFQTGSRFWPRPPSTKRAVAAAGLTAVTRAPSARCSALSRPTATSCTRSRRSN